MLERYLNLRSPAGKKLIDYKRNNPLSEAEYVTLTAIVRALKPIHLGSEKLCRRDVTLISGEGVVVVVVVDPTPPTCCQQSPAPESCGSQQSLPPCCKERLHFVGIRPEVQARKGGW